MSAPQYDRDVIFDMVITMTEEDCFYCFVKIKPETDDWYVHISIPGKTLTVMHPECFEALAWCMGNYIMDHRGNLEPERILN